MKKKELLQNFWQIFGFVRIFFVQVLGLFFLSHAVGLLAQTIGVRGCPPRPELLDWKLAVSLIIGMGLFWLAIHPIVAPRVWLHGVSREVSVALSNHSFRFFSTHPTYVLIDALLMVPAFIFFWNGQTEHMCEFNYFWGQGWAALLVAAIYPTLRLIFWHVLGKQIYAMQFQSMLRNIGWWYVLVVPLIIGFSYSFVSSSIMPRLRIPVIDAQTLAKGIDNHPEVEGQLVRVRGVLKRGIAKCGLWGKKDRTDYPYGTVVLDMGKNNGEIVVQAKTPWDVLDLEAEAQNKPGQIFETFGYLSRLPNPEKKMICGLEKLSDEPPKGGRALLEVEMPK